MCLLAVEQEKLLEEQREHTRNCFLSALGKQTRQMFAAREAMSDAIKKPELIDEGRLLVNSFEKDCIRQLTQGDSFDMVRVGRNHHKFAAAIEAFEVLSSRLNLPSPT